MGETADLYQPTTISSSELRKSGYPVFGANGYIGYYDKCNHNEDQVTISARGEGTGTPNFVVGPVWITGNSMVVNVDKEGRNINKYFLFNNFLSSNFKRYITGGAQPQLTREVLTTVKFHLPALTEQTVIGNFFQTLDRLITLHQRKCFGFKNVGIFMKDLVSDKKLGSKTYFNTLYDTLLRGGLSF
ncbi:restriction endonuclease subunit S, partial [Streptococcus hyointestinalis]